MQKVWCDNCGKEMRLEEKDRPEIAGSDWSPDVLCKLELRIIGKGVMPINLDLCVRCAKKYAKILSKPLDE